MGFLRGHLSIALVTAAFLLAAGPVSANPPETQEKSLRSEVERLASELKADSEEAITAAAEAATSAIEDSKEAFAEAEKTWSPRLQAFQQMLSDQKAALAIMGEDTATLFDDWKRAATESWNEIWSESWSETWSEMQHSANQVVEWFRAWIEKPPSSENTKIPT
jgi:hypothetical protein